MDRYVYINIDKYIYPYSHMCQSLCIYVYAIYGRCLYISTYTHVRWQNIRWLKSALSVFLAYDSAGWRLLVQAPIQCKNTLVGFAVNTQAKKIISGAVEDVAMRFVALASPATDQPLLWNVLEASGIAMNAQRNIGVAGAFTVSKQGWRWNHVIAVLARLVERIVSGAKAVVTTFVAIVKRKMLFRCVVFAVAGFVKRVMNTLSVCALYRLSLQLASNYKARFFWCQGVQVGAPHRGIGCGAPLHKNSGCFILRQSQIVVHIRFCAELHNSIVHASFPRTVRGKNSCLSAPAGLVQTH